MRFVLQDQIPFSRGLRKEVLYIFVSGTLALLFFFLTRPFGFIYLSNRSLIGFALVSMVTAVFYIGITHYLYWRYWEGRKWTLSLEILHSLFLLFFVALGILFYANLSHIAKLSFKNILVYLLYTLVLGIIPVVIRAILVRNWRLKRDLIEVQKINELLRNRKTAAEIKIIELPINRNETLKLTNHEIAYLESAENYITIFWNTAVETRKTMIRMTMKDAIKLINDPFIVFSHRSFVVNLRRVKEIVFQGGVPALMLTGIQQTIPLSGTYKAQIKKLLKEV